MRNRRTTTAPSSAPFDPRIAASEQRVLFRTGIFLLSVAIGFCFTRALYGLWHASQPLFSADHGKVKPVIDTLHNLSSGFSQD